MLRVNVQVLSATLGDGGNDVIVKLKTAIFW